MYTDTDLIFDETDLSFFVNTIWDNSFSENNGGMGAPDLFSLYFILNKFKPKVVVESGVWNGISTKLIRKVLPDSIIICLDPREIPSSGFKDNNKNTFYYLGNEFIDFKDFTPLNISHVRNGMPLAKQSVPLEIQGQQLPINELNGTPPRACSISNLHRCNLSNYSEKDILCFFDCHQNAYLRLKQCFEKKISHVFFNDNYPVKCGSHFTIEHLIHDDNRHYTVDDNSKKEIMNAIEVYKIFPNIYPGDIKTGEGMFSCCSYFTEYSSSSLYEIFNSERIQYRWNTFIKLTV